MCNSHTPKEDVIINQNGIGSTNSATTEQLQFHLSAISIVMITILGIIILLAACIAYKKYKKCHEQWINKQIIRQNFQRTFTRRRRCPTCAAKREVFEEVTATTSV